MATTVRPRTHAFIAAALFLVLGSGPAFAAGTSARQLLTKPDEWFATPEASRIAEDLISYQAPIGGWPKNVDTAGGLYKGDPKELHATFDNSATTDELRFMARMINAVPGEPRYRESFNRGLDYILKAQYPNGGWPQFHPPHPNDYSRYITFNDGSMARLMFFVREVAREPGYAFVDEPRRRASAEAFDRAVDCVLKCQIKVDGKQTAWCAQHDEVTFEPRPARSFEPASISGCETVGIAHALMVIEKPSPEVIRAIESAVAWLDSVKISGIKLVETKQEGTPKGFDRAVVEDPSALPMWARFYEIGTNKPIFCDRDGVVKYKLSDIGIERRTGYHWLRYWPKNLVTTEIAEWRTRIATTTQPGR